MNDSKNIVPKNEAGQLHGYCKRHYSNSQLAMKGVYIDGKLFGYIEEFYYNGSIWEEWTGYFLNDVKVSDSNESGYCYIWDKAVLV